MPSIVTQPADSAFTCGNLLADSADMVGLSMESAPQWGESLFINITCMFMVLFLLLNLRTIINIIPSLLSCALSGREVMNLESSLQLSRSRDNVALVCILPFCMLCARYDLWSPSFLPVMSPPHQFVTTVALLLAYMTIRGLVQLVLKHSDLKAKVWKAGNRSLRTFFILMAATTLCTAGVMDILSCTDALIKEVLVWETALIFTLFALRKSQIFLKDCSLFSTFLYLCALEILPAAIVVIPELYL